MPPERRARRERSVLCGLERFCAGQGLDSSTLANPLIAAYLCAGLEGRAPSTKGTYHSVLRAVGGIEAPKGAPRFAGSPAPAPYSRAERAELYAIARAQRRAWRVRSALALLALCLGTGVRSGELVTLRWSDVETRGDRVRVSLGPPAVRVIEMRPHEAALVEQLRIDGDGIDGDGYLFHPGEADRSYPNFVNDFCRTVEADPGAPRISAARARASFICDHFVERTPLHVLLEKSGIAEVESLLRYARHVERAPQSKAALRAALAAEHR
jgi:integrase